MKIIGHRGARGLAPENTLVALRKAVTHHVDEIEFDLRVTKDGVVILHHDPELGFGKSQMLVIDQNDFETLKHRKPDLTTFQEALDTLGKRARLYIEVKPDVNIAPIVNIIEDYLNHGWLINNMKLASFSQSTLLELDKRLPQIDKIVLEKWSGVRASRRARQLKTKYISMDQKWLWWGFVHSVAHSGYCLYTYTLNDPKKAKRWQKHGLYGVVTDYPDLFEKR